jgi:predicted phage-related endonuclease
MPWVGDFSYLVKGLSASPAQAEYLRPLQLRPPAQLHQHQPMCVTAQESRALSRLFGLLAEDLAEREVRERIGHHVLEWLSPDYHASFDIGEGRGRSQATAPRLSRRWT